MSGGRSGMEREYSPRSLSLEGSIVKYSRLLTQRIFLHVFLLYFSTLIGGLSFILLFCPPFSAVYFRYLPLVREHLLTGQSNPLRDEGKRGGGLKTGCFFLVFVLANLSCSYLWEKPHSILWEWERPGIILNWMLLGDSLHCLKMRALCPFDCVLPLKLLMEWEWRWLK